MLKNAKLNMNCLNIMVNLENDCNRGIAQETEKEQQLSIDRQRRIEREKQEHEKRVVRKNTFANDFFEKKRNEQKMKNRETQEGKRDYIVILIS